MSFDVLETLKNKGNYTMKLFNIIKRSKTKVISMLLVAALLPQTLTINAAVTNETVDKTFLGSPNGTAIINNLKYRDISNYTYNLKDAIYQNGVLDLLKGFGSTNFNKNGTISNQMALYLCYMAANRAQDIQTQGQALNNARAVKKTDYQQVLYDGSLQLAANEGLITAQQYADAMNEDQTSLEAGAFYRGANVQRQQFATWLAKTLLLSPAYEQQEIYNNFTDWRSALPENIPYIEAILQNNIMSGDGKGKFGPTQAVTREQAVTVLKNAENVILPIRKMEKRTATVEDITITQDSTKGYKSDYLNIFVRNSDGLLDKIVTEARYQLPTNNTNEMNKTAKVTYSTNIPVFRNGTINNASALKKGDRIEYIAGVEDSIVRYVRVLSNTGEISYVAARVNSINTNSRTLNVTPMKQTIKYPTDDVSEPDYQTYPSGGQVYRNYTYSNGVVYAVSKAPLNISDIKPPESIVILGIRNNIIEEVQPITVLKQRQQGLVPGIVEENNPSLGYITLYNGDANTNNALELSSLRTFNYADPNAISVNKNFEPADIDDIEPGDTVFIRLDDNGQVESINCVTNYSVKYGKVISQRIGSITVQLENGQQQSYKTDTANIIKDGKLVKLSALKDGDRVKLLINETPNLISLKEMIIEGDERLASNIYKGNFLRFDNISNKIVLSDPWVLRKGAWEKEQMAFSEIEAARELKLYFDGKELSKKATNYMKDSPIYIGGQNDYGDTELAVIASFVAPEDKEVTYDEAVYSSSPAAGKFTLDKSLAQIVYNAGSIIIKNGRYVGGNSITANDSAYVVANRDSSSGALNASVVSVEQRAGILPVQLIRGRISDIDPYKTVTLMSFSTFNGLEWTFSNTPKTLTLTSDTRIIDTDGIIGQGSFIDYGDTTYMDRTIYILCDGTNAVQISTAPFGNFTVSGEVLDLTGAAYADDGTMTQEPSAISLRNCKYYDVASHMWTSIKDSNISLISNTLVIKNNQIIKPSQINKKDKLVILKKDNQPTGEGYIVIVTQ